jgi:hypothetical protein
MRATTTRVRWGVMFMVFLVFLVLYRAKVDREVVKAMFAT